MVRTILVLSTLAAGLTAQAAQGAPLAEPSAPAAHAAGQSEILVAQAGDYQVFYDGRGNRVIVDAGTGRVIAVQPPGSRFDRRAMRLRERARNEAAEPTEDAPAEKKRVRA